MNITRYQRAYVDFFEDELVRHGYLDKYVDRPEPSKKGKEPMEPPVDNQSAEHVVNLLDRLSLGWEVNMIFKGTNQPPKR